MRMSLGSAKSPTNRNEVQNAHTQSAVMVLNAPSLVSSQAGVD